MKTKMLTVALLSALLGLTTTAFAQTRWKRTHPRRVEVNHRLAYQSKRIDNKVDNQQMSEKKSDKIQREDRQVRKEEKLMASQDHGHITKQEQKTLNVQENRISKQIRNN
ncbi:MAG TPA: hypothetical protein VNE41_11135 [Chitinophagaceae bacterium]|nr:hypothetical protein [Chitinophagaceae bacterium]